MKVPILHRLARNAGSSKASEGWEFLDWSRFSDSGPEVITAHYIYPAGQLGLFKSSQACPLRLPKAA